MIIDRLFGRLTDWLVERSLEKHRKRSEPTASCEVPGFGKFDLVQDIWQGELEASGFDLSVCIDSEGREIPEETVSLLRAVCSDLARLDEAARRYCDSLEADADRKWIEDCGGLELQSIWITLSEAESDFELCYGGVAWEDAMVNVAFKGMTPIGHFFAD